MNSVNEIENQLIEYLLGSVIFNVSKIDPDTELMDSGLLDSINIVKVIMYMEREFSVYFDSEDIDLKNFETVSAMSGLVRRKRRNE